MRRVRWPAFVAFAGGLVLVVVAWNSVKPSNDRDWQTEVAVLPYVTINGDLVTVHNIRNFDYRTETDFTPAHFELRAWTSHFRRWATIQTELAGAVYAALRDAGMTFPFPQCEVRLVHDAPEGPRGSASRPSDG